MRFSWIAFAMAVGVALALPAERPPTEAELTASSRAHEAECRGKGPAEPIDVETGAEVQARADDKAPTFAGISSIAPGSKQRCAGSGLANGELFAKEC